MQTYALLTNNNDSIIPTIISKATIYDNNGLNEITATAICRC
jgi:hypothetical protein